MAGERPLADKLPAAHLSAGEISMPGKYKAANLYFNIPPVSHRPYKLSKFNQRLSLIYCLPVPCWGAGSATERKKLGIEI